MELEVRGDACNAGRAPVAHLLHLELAVVAIRQGRQNVCNHRHTGEKEVQPLAPQ